MLSFRKVTEKLFDDYYIHIFDPGGIKLSKLWALKNPLDMRTYPLQEGGDDEYHPIGLFSLGQWPGQGIHNKSNG